MTDGLWVEPDVAITTGGVLSEQAQALKTNLDSVYACNDDIKTSFLGGDAQKYTTAVDNMKEAMYKLQSTIDATGAYLTQVGNAYKSARQANADAIQG